MNILPFMLFAAAGSSLRFSPDFFNSRPAFTGSRRNQRKARKARRQAHANGCRKAFALPSC